MASFARIDELRKKFEENPRRYFAPLANEYRKAGQVDQAIAICREYLPQQPGHMSGHIVYGQALYEARQFEEGKTVFETALSLDPENLIALRHLGDIALIIGDHEAARGWYRRVLEADPRNEEIQAQLLTLDQAAAFAPPAASSAEPAPTSSPAAPARPSQPTPPSAQTVVVNPSRRASSAAPTVEVPAIPPPQRRAEPAPVVPTSGGSQLPEPVASGAAESSPVASASLVGLETTSLADTEVRSRAEPVSGAPPQDSTETPVPRVSLLDLSLPTAAAEIPLAPSRAEPLEPAAARDAGPFVTETMAELYLQQGHRDEALRVYRALLDQRPGDDSLQARVAALEAELTANAAAPAPPPEPSPTPLPTSMHGGPTAEALTIRDVLVLVAMRRPGFHPDPLARNGGTPAVSEPALEPQPSAPGESSATPVITTMTSSVGRADAMTALFAGAQVSAEDEGAALALALAFRESNGGGPSSASAIPGAPAHRASNELSLDTVFGAAAGSAPATVSYDQFFAMGSSAAQGSGVTGGDRSDDVAHFTRWLEGLKRR